MFKYTIKRFLSMILVIWIVITVTFLLVHSIPGGPFTAEKKLPDAVLKNLEARYHLNDPLYVQYTDYLANVIQGDFGPSFKYEDRTVNQIIEDGFPVSAQLGILSIILAVLVGIPAGIVCAVWHNKFPDYFTMFFAVLGVSVPSFIIAPTLVYFFAYKLPFFPAAMWEGPEYMVLPTIALAFGPTAMLARLTRSSMLEILSQDYIRTARAKGLSRVAIIYKHALKNALIPIITFMGPMIFGILTGSFVIEQIFAIPGLGRYFVTSIFNRDYTAILGLTIFDGCLLVFANFVVDIAYGLVDPRIKVSK
ncbi:MAG: ABC transporter permease [Bacillota bacterium]